GYTSRDRPLAFFDGEIDDRYPALERVVGVSTGAADKAYPFPLLAETGVANDTVGGEPIVVFWGAPDTADALDAFEVAEGRGIGTGVAYRATV
ncbi:MAG: DUF3179 domain-containing protein, partial [Actinobacteria bacterium]|nr:DUF3179 domain-containing protein [Actinomycetota bacterium]NIS35864.1 DUF3179 domain-containing protein [Actinomycetota bacterium]NIT98390.1 DUF3179 domain-containing protein [Actinomycetota bacterium]NIU22003.1 DUF3179 domain-containing protein [Actinomycetota bacterium]NIU70482.1 DUF3179 domain-containing protein [Actinomycetota bacterium]